MSQTQKTIFGDSIDEQLEIETTGRVIRPIKRMLGHIANEYRLNFDQEGLHVRLVDAANVINIELDVPASAFKSYSVNEEFTIGLHSDTFGGVLQHARYGKSNDDEITLTADDTHIESVTNREIGGTEATITERGAVIDPDSVRSKPDIPDLDFEVEAEIPPKTFIEAIKHLNTESGNPVSVGSNPNRIVFQQEGEIQKRNIEIDVNPTEVSEFSMYSRHYVKDIQKILNDGYVDSLKLEWGEEYPIRAHFEREDVYSGHVMVAPRVTSQ